MPYFCETWMPALTQEDSSPIGLYRGGPGSQSPPRLPARRFGRDQRLAELVIAVASLRMILRRRLPVQACRFHDA